MGATEPEPGLESTRGYGYLHQNFEVHHFIHPYVIVTRRSDGVKGTVKWEPWAGEYGCFEPLNKKLEKR